jgi:broad specificity phosphatase PhoE
MKLIIVRHGETEENVKKIIQGKGNNRLTEKGKKQAKEVGKQLKSKYKIDMVFCSPLKRCQETLEEILSEYPIEGEIFMSNLIEERDFGEYDGIELSLINWEEINENNKLNQKMGVEPWSDVEKRVNLFLEDLKLEDDKKTILIVSHGGPIRVMINRLNKQNLKYHEIEVNNGQIMEFDYDTNLEF